MAPAESYHITPENGWYITNYQYGRKYFTGFYGLFETNNHILLNYRNREFVSGYYLVNKNRQEGRYYIRSIDEEIKEVPFFDIVETDGKSFISLMQAEDLVFLKDKKIKDKNNAGLAKLDSVLKALQEDDNPVLFFYTLDENY